MIRTDHDLTKLPKWAQKHIIYLERDLAHAHKRLAAGTDESDTFADYYSDTPRPLGMSAQVAFGTPIGDPRRAAFDVRMESDKLLVYSSSGRLLIEPSSSNVVRIHNDKY